MEVSAFVILKNVYRFERVHLSLAAFSLCFFFLHRIGYEQLMPFYDGTSYVSIHLILEFISIVVSFSIAIQGWMIFPHTLSMQRLWLAALFFSVGILDWFHTLTYPGMPPFLTQPSFHESVWFWILARSTEALGLLFIFSRPDEVIEQPSDHRLHAFFFSFVYTVAMIVVVYLYSSMLPAVVVEGKGTTLWKHGMEYAVCFIHAATMIWIFRRYRKRRSPALLYLLLALFFFILCECQLAMDVGVNDLYELWAHIYKAVGFLYFMRGIYLENIEQPYIELKQHEQQLEMMTNALGEGVIMLNREGRIVWMNPEAERLLGWSFAEARNKPLFEFIYRVGSTSDVWSRKDLIRLIKPLKNGEVIRVDEEEFCRKDGTYLPVSYTLAPVLENGTLTSMVVVFRDTTEKKEKERLERERQQLDLELSLAANMQRSLLQDLKEMKLPSYVDVGVLSVPARILSGDFYHFSAHQTSFSVGIADVSGKGIPAAMLMTLMKFILDRTLHYGTQPHIYLDLLNRFVYDYTEASMFVTMFVGNYNEKNHTFSYASAGHEPGLLYRAETHECVPLATEGCALGLFPQFAFETKSVRLESGDIILLYTDGVTERRDSETGDDFSVLAEMMKKIDTTKSAQEIIHDLYEQVKAYHQYEIKDDQTLLLLRRK